MVSTEHKQNAQKTVKAYDLDIALINEHARRLSCSAAEVIHLLCEDLRKHLYLNELGESFELATSEQLSEFKAEQKAWDCTLLDGLNKDGP